MLLLCCTQQLNDLLTRVTCGGSVPLVPRYVGPGTETSPGAGHSGCAQWRTEGGFGVFKPPRNSEVLTKLHLIAN